MAPCQVVACAQDLLFDKPSLATTARKLNIFRKSDDISGETKLQFQVEREDGFQSVSVWGAV
jgi:hypothetical protein